MSLWDRLFQKGKEEQQKEFDLVSRLVEETFGKGFKPDYCLISDNQRLCMVWERTGYPTMIARPTSQISHPLKDEDAGYFVGKSGSILMVNEEYIKPGLTYARRYEEDTGKKVTLKIARWIPKDGMNCYEAKDVNLRVVR